MQVLQPLCNLRTWLNSLKANTTQRRIIIRGKQRHFRLNSVGLAVYVLKKLAQENTVSLIKIQDECAIHVARMGSQGDQLRALRNLVLLSIQT